MDQALRIGKNSATGGFQLFIAKSISTVLMAVGLVFLARIISPEEYGLYSLAVIPAATIILFQDWGIGAAMTKFSAYFKASNKRKDLHNTIVAGITFEVATGLALSVLSLFLANIVASAIFRRPAASSLIWVSSATIFAGALLTASQSTFVGFEKMNLYSLTIICQSLVQTIMVPLLVFLGYGALGAVVGFTLSFLTAGIMGVAMLYFFILRRIREDKTNRSEVFKTLKTMLRYGVPVSLSSILFGLVPQLYWFVISFFCNDTMIGNYRVATNLEVVLTFITFPVTSVLFPAFAKLDNKIEHQLLKNIFTSSIKYTTLLLVPATMVVMVLSKPLIIIVFGNKWIYAPFLLTVSSAGNLFVALGKFSIGGFLTGQGETKTLMEMSLGVLALSIPLAFLLIPPLGVTGAIIGGILGGVPSLFLGLHMVWKKYEAGVDLKCSAKILAASAIAATVTYSLSMILNTTELLKLAIGGITFLAVYVVVAPATGAISQSDIHNLRSMLSDQRFVSKVANIPLTIMEKIARK